MSIQIPSRKEGLGNADLSIMVSLVRLSVNWVEMLHNIPLILFTVIPMYQVTI